MKSTFVMCVIACAINTWTAAASAQHSSNLENGWSFRCVGTNCGTARASAQPADTTEWQHASVPGDIVLDLLSDGKIQDPFYRDNEAKLQWISERSWEYRRTLEISSAQLSKHRLELVFDGLDAYAQVFVNDHLALTANNQFRAWRIDLKPFVHSGVNYIRVRFPNQDEAAEAIAETDPWFPRNTVPAKSYVRKAAYEHGWDWGPKFVLSGIWRPVRLEAYDTVRIEDVYAEQRDVTAAEARMTVKTSFEAASSGVAHALITISGPGFLQRIERQIPFHMGDNTFDVPVEVAQPHLWFPAGYGDQSLYRVSAVITTSEGAQKKSVRVGLRSLVLRRQPDQWGRSFEFVVNGIPIFAKGADVIPSDSFANRVTAAKLRTMLQSAKDSNMNTVRVWGGGYYETDDFYDLCDELGLLVWQDFMFGNDWQPGTYGFEQNVEIEAEQQIRRLRNHPSLAAWCGNNETEQAFHWLNRDKLDPAIRFQMWQDYLTLFYGVLARSVARFDPEVPYWPSSPSADLEPTSATFQSGDDHVWDVWHGRVPFSTYETHYPRFVTEFGFQSFPEERTVEAFTNQEDRTGILTPVMLAHQKNPEGNELIRTYMLRDYPEPKDFSSFLYVSQVLQAEGIKLGSEHFRRQRPRTMGVLFWQLNDCWPVASWSSIDYFGRWKALQFYAKRFFSPVLISPTVKDGRLDIYAVSDRTSTRSGKLTVEQLGFDGHVFTHSELDVTLAPLTSSKVFSVDLTHWGTSPKAEEAFISTRLDVAGEPTSRNLVYSVPTKEISLPIPHLHLTAKPAPDGFEVSVNSDLLARDVYITSGDANAVFEDNYFDVLPGETRTIRVRSKQALEVFRRALVVRSLADAFPIPTKGEKVSSDSAVSHAGGFRP